VPDIYKNFPNSDVQPADEYTLKFQPTGFYSYPLEGMLMNYTIAEPKIVLRFKAYQHSNGAYRIAVSPYIKYDYFRAYTTLGIFARYKIKLTGNATLVWQENKSEHLQTETVNIIIDGSSVPNEGPGSFEVKPYCKTTSDYQMY
jgi:hypothetical protein